MTIEGYSIRTAGEFVGQELGVTDWVVIDRSASAGSPIAPAITSGLRDAERAAREGPFGGTIAHGFLCLSLLAPAQTSIAVTSDAAQVLNYGLDRVRFMAPVKTGSRVLTAFICFQRRTRGLGVSWSKRRIRSRLKEKRSRLLSRKCWSCWWLSEQAPRLAS